MHLVKKAENVRSCRNIFHAVIATLGLGLFNLVFVLVPFILLVVMLLVLFIIGVIFTFFGPVAFVYSVLPDPGITGIFHLALAPCRSFHLHRYHHNRAAPDHRELLPCPVLLPCRDPVSQVEYQRHHRNGACSMNAQKPDNDRLAYFVGSLNLSGLTMTKVILWLVAITIVSFAIGFGILALSGDLASSSDSKVSPFRQYRFIPPEYDNDPS